MQSQEASAKTRKEAIQKALDELGVELHEVEIEVLDEGSRGFLGLGSRDVRVRVTAEGLPDRPQSHKRPKTSPVSEPIANEAAALLGEIIAHMGIEANVTCTTGEEGSTLLSVDSPDSALLIGRKGRNLNALQYLINRMFLADSATGASARLVVDIEGYQDRRRQTLEDMAQHLAQRAKRTGREMRVKPLNPQERRIIHVALQDDPDVRTFSLGNSLLRTVVISPKTNGNQTKPSRGGGHRRNPNARGNRPASGERSRRS